MTTAKPMFQYTNDSIKLTEHFTPDSTWSITTFNSEKIVGTTTSIDNLDLDEDKVMQAQFKLVRKIEKLRAEILKGNLPSTEIEISESKQDDVDLFWIKVSQFDK